MAPDGSTVATARLTTTPVGPTTTTAGPPADRGDVHPEEGSYVVAPGEECDQFVMLCGG